jgi:hypothetical protein
MTSFAEREHRARLGLDRPIDEPKPKPRMSMDQLLDMANQIAQDPESGPDRFRAIKMLTQVQTATVMLNEPMNDGEVVERLARVLKGAGPAMSQIAYGKAFPNHKHAIASNITVAYADATPEQVKDSKRTTSLKLLYTHFPEAKRHGVPKGFPSGRSLVVKSEWCQNQALKLIIERETRERQGAHEAMKAADTQIRGAMDGSTPTP